MAENAQPSGHGWLRADPDKLVRFADELDEIIAALEHIRAKEADAASFRSPSTDPATMRTTHLLAGDAYDMPNTAAGSIAAVIRDLTQQVRAARLAARDYQAVEQESVQRLNKAGEQLT
jgi:hypothetical protein